jgi:hypothetical protein
LTLLLLKCPNIEILNLSHCKLITGEALASNKILYKLKILDLLGTLITEKNLGLVIAKCPNIESLNVTYCPSITDKILASSPIYEQLKALNRWNISNSRYIIRNIWTKMAIGNQ